jgi:pimeloyl-ACP methyl ester carboxylesterase
MHLTFTPLRAFGLAALVALSFTACQTAPPDAASAVKTITVNGYLLPYVEQGRGETLVLVHGAISDYRIWDRQRAMLANRFRTVAYTQRYFGAAPWDPSWPKFNQQTHADDLAAMIRALNTGPVHLVAWSYSGHVALLTALQHPELVKSAFVFEPADPTYVTDADALKQIGADAAGFGPAAKAVQAGDNAEAVKQLVDMVGERSGYFDAQPASLRTIQLDSARSMSLLMKAPPAPPISCEQLGQMTPPVAIVRGGAVRPYFRLIADAAMRCMPRGSHKVIANAKHLWPGEEPAAFSEAVTAFIAEQR